MPVLDQTSSVTRDWTGVETLFTTNMFALDAAHVIVKTATATLVRDTHYTSELAVGTNFLVIRPLPAMPSAPQTLTIERSTPAIQPDNPENTNTYDADAFEAQLDRVVLVAQELRPKVETALAAALATAELIDGIVLTGPVQRVNGKTGDVVLVKDDIADLVNIDNTSDADKPVSTATQAALDAKVDLENETTVPTGAATLNIIHQLNFFRDARNWTGFDLTGSASSNVAMQNVANFCRDTGERVTFPPALIRLTEQIEFEDRSSIVGPRWPGVYDPGKALWLHFDHIGQGLYFGGVAGSHQLENVGFVRTQPNPGSGWAPTDYGYDIEGFTQDLLLRNVLIRSSTRAIKMTGIARLIAENVKGQVFKRGLEIESAYDTCIGAGIKFYPIWSTDDDVRNSMLENLIAFSSLRNDNPFFTNIFSIWHNIGFRIGQFAGAPGRVAGTTSKAKIMGADLDLGRVGVQADVGADGFSAEFHALSVQGADDSATHDDALINVLSNNGRLLLVQADLREGGGNLIRAQGSGNYVGVTGFNSGAFNKTGSVWPAVEATAGNTIEIEGATTASPALTYATTGSILTNDWRSFTPTFGASTSGPPTVGSIVARYRRTKKRLEFSIAGTITALNGSSGDFEIRDLPVANGSGMQVAVQAFAENTPAVLCARVNSGGTTVRVSANGGGFPASGTQFRVWGAYETA